MADGAREAADEIVARFKEGLSFAPPEEFDTRLGKLRDEIATALAASAPVPDAGGGEATKVCGWCAREGHTTDGHHDDRCERYAVLSAGIEQPCRCADRARAALPPAAPPVPDDAPMPEDVARAAFDAAASSGERAPYYAAAEVAYRAGLAARRPAGEEAGARDAILRNVLHAVVRTRDGEVSNGIGMTYVMLALGALTDDDLPPRPAGVDREKARRVRELVKRFSGHGDCPCGQSFPSAQAWLDHFDDLLAAALAPLLGGEQ